MTQKYFRLDDNLYFEGRWHLCDLFDSTGIELEAREFTYGNRINSVPTLKCLKWNDDTIVNVKLPLRVSWSRYGTPMDFTYTDECAPVVTRAVAQLLFNLADNDIQRIPVHVDRMEEDYEIINVSSCIECIDTEKSEIEWFEEGNDIRPDLAGTPKAISKLVIDPTRVGNHHIFRAKGWEIVIVVSEVIKQAFEVAEITGVCFREV